ncbi:MAG: phosphoribosylamine--glycine ligase [bacterium]|nr:phosphoribosylamine--glycine ligase [bacterium]
MRILGIGETNDLGDMYLRLVRAGHDVRVFVGDRSAHDVLAGSIARVEDWADELPWIRAAGDEGLILFEGIGFGAVQDQLRREGVQVIGGGALGDRLQGDRAFGQATLRELGFQTAASHHFVAFDDAIAFLRARGGRWVFELGGEEPASSRTYVGELDDAADLIALVAVQRDRWSFAHAPRFILTQHVRGIEMGVGAYFDGDRFLLPASLDWQHQALFPGGLGELSGEMGTLVTYRDSERFFAATLARLAPLLHQHQYVGYINLNTIVNDAGIWPLAFTCRFGYPGFAILDTLQSDGWSDLFQRIVSRRATTFATHDGWALGVLLTVPPFPYAHDYERLSSGLPILFRAVLTDDERNRLKLGEVAFVGEQMITAGSSGCLAVATGRGNSVAVAQRRAYDLARKVVVPRMRYRNDIGDAFIGGQHAELRRLGWLP